MTRVRGPLAGLIVTAALLGGALLGPVPTGAAATAGSSPDTAAYAGTAPAAGSRVVDRPGSDPLTELRLPTRAQCAAEGARRARPIPKAAAPLHDQHVGVSNGAAKGGVELRSRHGYRQFLTPLAYEDGGFGGGAIHTVSFQGRELTVVGESHRTVNGQWAGGGIHFFERTDSGACYIGVLTVDNAGIVGDVQRNGQFGYAVASAASAGGDRLHLLVGEPSRNVGDVGMAGAVHRIEITPGGGGRWLIRDRRITVDIGPQPNEWPRFGESLAVSGDRWYAGAPGARVNGAVAAGVLARGSVRDASVGHVFSQGRDGLAGKPEDNDYFAETLATVGDLVLVGSPQEGIGGDDDAGVVQTLRDTGGEVEKAGPAYSQDSADDGSGRPVTGTAEWGDWFGGSLAAYESTAPDGTITPRVLVGASGETIDSMEMAGMVVGLYGAPSFTQASVGGRIAADNGFGESVSVRAAGADDARAEVLIGAPKTRGETTGEVAHGIGLARPRWDRWRLSTAELGPEDGQFGWELGTPQPTAD